MDDRSYRMCKAESIFEPQDEEFGKAHYREENVVEDVSEKLDSGSVICTLLSALM